MSRRLKCVSREEGYEGSVRCRISTFRCTDSPLDLTYPITGVLSSTQMFIGFTPEVEVAQI